MTQSTVAPKERVNIVFKPNVDSLSQEVELPLKLLVLGKCTACTGALTMNERTPVNITKRNFDVVLREMAVSVDCIVPNRLNESDQDNINVHLEIDSLKDFEPNAIARQLPELKALLNLRRSLIALKGPLGNSPKFRLALESALKRN